jgi:hypothetical protein
MTMRAVSRPQSSITSSARPSSDGGIVADGAFPYRTLSVIC